jgi:hypothetical protein
VFFGAPPGSDTAAALMALASYLVFTGTSYFVEKRPER